MRYVTHTRQTRECRVLSKAAARRPSPVAGAGVTHTRHAPVTAGAPQLRDLSRRRARHSNLNATPVDGTAVAGRYGGRYGSIRRPVCVCVCLLRVWQPRPSLAAADGRWPTSDPRGRPRGRPGQHGGTPLRRVPCRRRRTPASLPLPRWSRPINAGRAGWRRRRPPAPTARSGPRGPWGEAFKFELSRPVAVGMGPVGTGRGRLNGGALVATEQREGGQASSAAENWAGRRPRDDQGMGTVDERHHMPREGRGGMPSVVETHL